jgi:translation elongation factor EF-1beta
MAKEVVISILLVPESKEVDNDTLRSEIMEYLNCPWASKVIDVKVVENVGPNIPEEG